MNIQNKRSWAAGLIVLAVLLFITWKCGRNSAKPKDRIVTSKQQVKVFVKDSLERKKISDSFTTLIKFKDNQIIKATDKYESLMIDFLTQIEEGKSVALLPVPDTCKPYQLKVQAQMKELELKNKSKDKAAKDAILKLQDGIKDRNNFLKQKDKDYDTLKSRWQTCIDNTKKLEKIKGKREIGIGAAAITNYKNFSPAVGLSAYYRSQKGFAFSLGYYSNNSLSATLSIPIIKF